MADEIRLLARRGDYTSDPTRAVRTAGEAVGAAAQEEITAAVHQRERDMLLTSWAHTSQRMRSALDHFETHAPRVERMHLRSSLRALRRQLDQLDQRVAR